ncbi:hypothetical protein SLITO_v1c10660 [Spiroplasma litorale]|uniref:Uncharacterized protein n=1 Tax=Spiroplasma litorale TaxID=216942 RepID=A0A0K1W3J2_9MOLU|nr:hypothetical protein [Spiroplasma litorale]AKX34677.1 hypothetical protein SLITO_v1c10660 [Spiroplasma litorale]
MSFEMKKVTFINKKVTPIEVDFETNDFITSVIANNYDELKAFKNILIGKHLVRTGSFKINGFDKVNKEWTKKHVSVVGINKYFRKWPEKFWLSTSLLWNKDYYNNAKINYINKKYDYLSFLTSKNIKEDLIIREKIEKMILTFIDSSVEIEEQWLKDFLKQIVEFNNKNIDEKNDTLEEHIKIIAKDYYLLYEKTKNYELLETFLQSLWDKVYNFIELTSLCKCEYISKKSKDKSIKKLTKHLNFNQVNYVVRKQLKIIDIKINYIRFKILRNEQVLKNLKKQINFELLKVNKINKKLKNPDAYFFWRNVGIDQRLEFVLKQEKMFFDGLSDESTTLRGKIVEVVHGYHKLVLDKKVVFKKNEEFKEKAKLLKSEIKSMASQSKEYINELVEKLDLKLDLFSIKWNTVINIWFQILKCIFLNKYNIVFYKVLEKLSLEEIKELFYVLKNINKLNNKFNFIFLDNKVQNVANLDKDFYVLEKSKINKTSFSSYIKDNWKNNASEIFYNKNKISYTKEKDKVNILNNKIKLIKSDFINDSGFVLLDPTRLTNKKKENKNNLFDIKGYIKENKIFTDDKVKYFVSSDKTIKLYFYSNDNFNLKDKVNIYVTEDAIFKIT